MKAIFLLAGAAAGGAMGADTLLLVALLLAGSAFFSGAETAVVSASRARLERLAQEGHRDARAALTLLEDTPRAIAATLVGTNLCNILAASLATAFALTLRPEDGPAIATAILTPVVLFGSEILPKALFRSRPTRLLRGSAGALLGFSTLFRPVIAVASGATRALLFLLRVPAAERRPVFAREDLENLFLFGVVRESGGEDAGTHETLRMAGRVLDLVRRKASQAMATLPADRTCPASGTVGDAVERFRVAKRGALAVTDETGDVSGFVAAKELLGLPMEEPLASHVRQAYPLGREDTLDRAITGLRRSRLSVAVVRGSSGRVLGVVTPEDLLEEVVGELRQHHPPPKAQD